MKIAYKLTPLGLGSQLKKKLFNKILASQDAPHSPSLLVFCFFSSFGPPFSNSTPIPPFPPSFPFSRHFSSIYIFFSLSKRIFTTKKRRKKKMLDSCPNGNPYSPRANGAGSNVVLYSTAGTPNSADRRRSSSVQRYRSAAHQQLPEVVAEVMARHQAELANLHGDLGRSSSAREDKKPAGGLFIKHMVERSQSQLSRPTARVLNRSECQRMGRSRRSYDYRSSEHLDGGLHQSAPELTLVLMGAPKTGKSALVNQFLWEGFLADYRPTVEEFNWVEYGRADQPESNFLLQLIDSSGSRDFLAMRHLYYRIGDAFMVVYAADDPQSYSEALAMLREIEQQNCKDAPILLIQNKSDLVARDSPSNLSDNSHGCPLLDGIDPEVQKMLVGVRRMRVSAKNLEQVKGAFWWLIEELFRRSQLAQQFAAVESAPKENGANRRGSSALVAASKAALTRRRQSMPTRRRASELGIDEEALKRLMKKHETQSRHGCVIQ